MDQPSMSLVLLSKDLLSSGLTPFQVGRPMSRDRTIDLPTWNGAYRRLRLRTGSTIAPYRRAGSRAPPIEVARYMVHIRGTCQTTSFGVTAGRELADQPPHPAPKVTYAI